MQASSTQQAIIDARGKNILVSASAGSGKTSVLVSRLCDLVIQDRIGIDQILAMTFTEDAAGEMKRRLKKQLQQQDLNDPWIARQLALLETASISTIHQFCLSLVQKYYYLLPIPYSMSRNVETGMKNAQALAQAYEKAVALLPVEDYAALKLYLQAFGQSEEDLQETILKFLEISRAKPNPAAWMESCKTSSPEAFAWFLQYFRLRIGALKEIMDTMAENIADLSFAKQAKQQEWITIFEKKSSLLAKADACLEQQDYTAFQKAFVAYMENTGKFPPSINKVRFDALQKDSRALEAEISDVLFDLPVCQQRSQEMLGLQNTFVQLALTTQNLFQEEKRRMEIIDFSDMEQFAWQLLSMPAVAQEIKARYAVIMVDEYQDTNDLQESILSLCARDDNVFRVGDVKQSIYGFRQARPDLMRSLMNKQDPLYQTMVMDENFRSSASLIAFNNVFFQTLMNTPGLDSQFSDQDLARPGLPAQKEGVQKPARFLYTLYGGWTEEGAQKTNDIKARKVHKANRIDLIAADIQEKIKEGYEYRDIAILTRAATNHNTIREGLEAYGIPLISKAKRGFYTNQAIQIVMATLKSMVNPRDDIAFMAMLCSPIGKCTQADVVEAAAGRTAGTSLYDAVRTHSQMIGFYRKLASWKQLPVGEIVEKIYNFNDFYYSHTTRQDKTNLDLFLEKASQAEQDLSLEAFTELILQEEAFNETSEAMPFGREANVVKVNSIHSSKGLQYPVVYLLTEDQNRDLDAGSAIYLDPDLGVSLMYLSKDRHIKAPTIEHLALETRRFMEDQSEKMRLLYVACTRAEKELIFVDTLKNLEDYDVPLSLRTIWKNGGFTSWAAHLFVHYKHPLFVMEEKGILERPESDTKKNFYQKKKTYSRPVQEVTSQTASSAKVPKKWKTPSFTASRGMERGTLFHTMAESLPYPYQADDVQAMARQQNMELSDKDLEQFLSLNDNPVYAKWMAMPHTFEAPYNVYLDGAFLHGYMDLLVEDEKDVHILDFKTDSVISMERLEQVYKPQLQAYQNALRHIYPDKTIHIWLYSFFLQALHEIS